MSGGDGLYRKWAELQAAGMHAATAKTARNRLSGDTLASVRRATRERFPCKVKDCARTAFKGSLCKAHWQLVPYAEKVELQLAVMNAQRQTAAKYHRKFLRQVNAQLSTPAHE